MTAKDVITYFENNYPGRNIVSLPAENPTEIICEIDPTSEHPEHNTAIAAIKRSEPHYHKEATEYYKIIKGTLTLYVDGREIVLNEGSEYTIKPKSIHYATGDFAIVEVKSSPGWTSGDHILI